jgi:hypothetical protein
MAGLEVLGGDPGPVLNSFAISVDDRRLTTDD